VKDFNFKLQLHLLVTELMVAMLSPLSLLILEDQVQYHSFLLFISMNDFATDQLRLKVYLGTFSLVTTKFM
jgi:hypothetical protein